MKNLQLEIKNLWHPSPYKFYLSVSKYLYFPIKDSVWTSHNKVVDKIHSEKRVEENNGKLIKIFRFS